jgi:nucleoid-associated protein YgaU
MPNDAKLGLAVGVCLVILVAVLFFRQGPPDGQPAATIARPGTPPRDRNTTLARGMSRTAPTEVDPGESRWHTVEDGDTLFSLAQRYYGDGAKYLLIYRANRERLGSLEELAPGMVLEIPEKSE